MLGVFIPSQGEVRGRFLTGPSLNPFERVFKSAALAMIAYMALIVVFLFAVVAIEVEVFGPMPKQKGISNFLAVYFLIGTGVGKLLRYVWWKVTLDI